MTAFDLKRGNILVTKAGVKLLDFGLSKRSEVDATVTMAVMSTPAYISPEQWEGKPGDARSDIYAFGCVLYEMLTGKRAAQERKPVEPAALEEVLAGCLEKDPDDRWQSARDLKRALALPSTTVMKAGPLWPWIAAVMAATVLSAFISLVLSRGRAVVAGDLVSFAIYPSEKTFSSASLNTTVNVPQFALSPDGRTIVFVAGSQGGKPMLWTRSMEQVSARPLPGTEDAQDPFWSPDSNWMGFFADGKLKKIPAAGGNVQVVAQTASDFRGGAWGPDNTIVFANGTGHLYRVASTGGTATPAPMLTEGNHRYPQFLPDGRHFLYETRFVRDQWGAKSFGSETLSPLVHEEILKMHEQGGCGSLTDNSTWDGTHGVINSTTNTMNSCSTPTNISGTISANYSPGASSFGVGFGNFQSLSSPSFPIANHELFVNGVDMGVLETLAGANWTAGLARNAYLRVDGTNGTVINSIAVETLSATGATDVMVLDHIAVQAAATVPEPSTDSLLLVSLVFLGLRFRKPAR